MEFKKKGYRGTAEDAPAKFIEFRDETISKTQDLLLPRCEDYLDTELYTRIICPSLVNSVNQLRNLEGLFQEKMCFNLQGFYPAWYTKPVE